MTGSFKAISALLAHAFLRRHQRSCETGRREATTLVKVRVSKEAAQNHGTSELGEMLVSTPVQPTRFIPKEPETQKKRLVLARILAVFLIPFCQPSHPINHQVLRIVDLPNISHISSLSSTPIAMGLI